MRKLLCAFLIVFSLVILLAGVSCAKSGADQPAEETPQYGPEATQAWQPQAPEEGNLLVFYWKGAADLATSDIWMWWDGKDGSGNLMEADPYGARCAVVVPQGVEQVGFIVRTDCSDPGKDSWGSATKDWSDDRYAKITGKVTEIYLKTGDPNQYRSSDGGQTLEQIRFFDLAGIISENAIRVYISPGTELSAEMFSVTVDGRQVGITGLSEVWRDGTSAVLNLAEPIDIGKVYTVSASGYGDRAAVPTEIFDSEAFKAAYLYDGDDLGAVTSGGKTTFKVWAPTASAVVVNTFAEGSDRADGSSTLISSVPMEKLDRGVWSATLQCGHGTYYTYTVTTSAGTQEAVDPYARAVGVNGNRGMVVDLDSTDPAHWDEDRYVDCAAYSDAVVWEVHVRDFSNTIAESEYKGKYLAFTETGLTNSSGTAVGVDYLKKLGITHVHLQPTYDFATVDETQPDTPQFNWGYDPKNYNAPEGSYSTDPYHGEVRINEFKQMVRGLHQAGIGVVLDMVYNHTYDINSNLNRIVPYYYYRYNSSGVASNGSGCGNETASDREMFRKYMVDSVVYWLTEYHVDGFRFDLMALHDIETMQAIEQAVHAINPSALIYGEGWTGGTTTLPGSRQASQANIAKITATPGSAGAVAVFNDAIRDGLKGSVFSPITRGYVNGTANPETAMKVSFGLKGGAATTGVSWSVKNGMVVNYMSSHDNHTLWDKLEASMTGSTKEEKLRAQKLGATVVFISKGMPFFLAGEEMLRTKGGEGNSYKSPDSVNNLDWESLVPSSDELQMAGFYADLIALRKACPFINLTDVYTKNLDGYAIEATYRFRGSAVAYAVVNPAKNALSYTLPSGQWTLRILGTEFGDGTKTVSGTVEVPAMGVLLVDKPGVAY